MKQAKGNSARMDAVYKIWFGGSPRNRRKGVISAGRVLATRISIEPRQYIVRGQRPGREVPGFVSPSRVGGQRRTRSKTNGFAITGDPRRRTEVRSQPCEQGLLCIGLTVHEVDRRPAVESCIPVDEPVLIGMG